MANFDLVEGALRREYPGVFEGEKGEKELRVFWRKWICKWLSVFCSLLYKFNTYHEFFCLF